MLRLFEISLNDILLEKLYNAACAGINYNIIGSERGVLIKVNGFSQKVPVSIFYCQSIHVYICNFL